MAVTNYLWSSLDDCVVMEQDGSGQTTAVYTHEPGQFGGLISERRGAESRYSHHDALGSTRQLTDSGGQVTDGFLYDAFGNTIQRTGTTMVPYHFVGRKGYYQDEQLDHYHVRERFYDPRHGRWKSVDPVRHHGRDADTMPHAQVDVRRTGVLEPYPYADNAPVIRIDPSGCWPILGNLVLYRDEADRWCPGFTQAYLTMECPTLLHAARCVLAWTVPPSALDLDLFAICTVVENTMKPLSDEASLAVAIAMAAVLTLRGTAPPCCSSCTFGPSRDHYLQLL